MFAFLICILALHQAQSACVLQDICTDSKAVQDEIVEMHNGYRKTVQPPAADMLKMSYSEKLAASSQAWVDECNVAHGPPSTRMLDGYELGENLFYSNSPVSWTEVILAWHNEAPLYQYPESAKVSTGHYVQIVWNSSYKVGCGVALCPNNIYFYACQYNRAGNFQNWPPYKPGSPCDLCPNDCEDNLCTNPCPYIDYFLNCPSMKAKIGCGHKQMKVSCPASCTCFDKIIPIY
ncbi:cysteine-rich venom protein [Notolabrus celidotus]|uniref:cysteine-rich venom protein n=1 Tax=Notolabrus celidotus TaxID=1203425 RepID=UPI001490412F|nr:cysteine-rich venom protein [Notolabrus celidotus]